MVTWTVRYYSFIRHDTVNATYKTRRDAREYAASTAATKNNPADIYRNGILYETVEYAAPRAEVQSSVSIAADAVQTTTDACTPTVAEVDAPRTMYRIVATHNGMQYTMACNLKSESEARSLLDVYRAIPETDSTYAVEPQWTDADAIAEGTNVVTARDMAIYADDIAALAIIPSAAEIGGYTFTDRARDAVAVAVSFLGYTQAAGIVRRAADAAIAEHAYMYCVTASHIYTALRAVLPLGVYPVERQAPRYVERRGAATRDAAIDRDGRLHVRFTRGSGTGYITLYRTLDDLRRALDAVRLSDDALDADAASWQYTTV